MTDTTTITPKAADAGPIPDSLKRTEPVVYSEISALDLAKLINADYGVILSSERMNLKRAKDVGEKLVWLKAKAPPKEWQSKLAEWCPKLSYETANKYMRVYVKWLIIEKRAAAKNVVTTDLTLDSALKLLANPNPKTKTSNSNSGTTAPTTSGGGAPANDDTNDDDNEDADEVADEDDDDDDARSDEDIAKDWLRVIAVDQLVTVLQEVCDAEYLTKLALELAKALRPATEQTQSAAAGTGNTSSWRQPLSSN